MMKDLVHTVIPEEFFFQTIILNSPYKLGVVTQNMQYFHENKRNGSAPAYLYETDYEKIIDSEKFFAREIDMNISKELLELIDENTK